MFTSIVGQYYYRPPMIDRHDFGWGIGMSIIWFFILIALIAVVVHVFRGHDHHSHHGLSKTDPLDIAKERYAKGEITKDEYEQLKKDLSKS